MLAVMQREALVATLSQNPDTKQWVLKYEPDAQTDINPRLPRSGVEYIFRNFPRCFESLLPKGPRLEGILRRHDLREDDYLGIVRHCLTLHNVGDILLTPLLGGDELELTTASSNILVADEVSAIASYDGLTEVLDRVAASGLGGSYPKAFVNTSKHPSILKEYEEKNGVPAEVIALSEERTLAAYRSIGGEAAEARAYGRTLDVKRFDIDESGRFHTICHLADLLIEKGRGELVAESSMHNANAIYNGSINRGVKNILACKDIDSQQIARELVRQYIFCWVAGDCDHHTENFGLLGVGTPQKWKMAPLYDALPAKVILNNSDDVAMAINGKKNSFSMKDLCELGTQVGFDRHEIEGLIDTSVHAIEEYVMPVLPTKQQASLQRHLVQVRLISQGVDPKEVALMMKNYPRSVRLESVPGFGSVHGVYANGSLHGKPPESGMAAKAGNSI